MILSVYQQEMAEIAEMGELFETLPEQSEQRETARSGGRVRLRQPDRDQLELRVCDLDVLIGSGHPAHTIWAYVERLDLSAWKMRSAHAKAMPVIRRHV